LPRSLRERKRRVDGSADEVSEAGQVSLKVLGEYASSSFAGQKANWKMKSATMLLDDKAGVGEADGAKYGSC